MSYTTYLAHHGIKGQKWGVRRYQNEDGSLTYAGQKRLGKISKKYDRKAKIVSKIVSTLSDDEYLLLNPGVSRNRLRTLGRDYYDKSAGETYGRVAKRIIIRDKKLKPVSYLDAHVVNYDGEKPGLNISIATANNNGTRGKGYADKAVKKMLKWHAKNKKIFGDIEWDVAPNNVASRRLAEKNGFEYNYTGSNGWVQYIHHSALSKEVSHSVIVNDDIYSYRSYLAHHGIKGQKWGVRRFQNYDGTRIKSGSQLVRDISRKHNPLYKQTFIEKLKKDGHWDEKARARRDAAINEVAERIGNKHQEIVSDLEKKYEKDLDDYGKNHYKFEALAGLSVAYHDDHAEKETEDEARKTKENRMLWYMFDDGDQGSFNSVDYFLVSKGKNPTEYAAKMENDKAKALDDIKKLVKPVLGEPDDPEVYKEVLDSVADELFWRAEDPRWSAVYHNASGEHSRYDDDEIKFMQDDIKNYSKEAEDFVRKQIPNLGHSAMSFSEQLSVVPSYGTYLAHHGIKGQKWGVRRFQKADGSLTAAGAKRYGIKGAMSAGRKVGSGLVKAARGGIQKAKEVKARKAAEKLERQKKVWAKTRLGLTMNADKFSIEELREANNRLDERDRAARGLAEQVKRGVGYFQAIRDVTGAIKDTKDYIEDISGEKGKKAKAADELKYQRELEKEKRTYERDMVRDQVKANQEYEYKREKDRLDRESKEKIEKMKAKAKKKKESGGSDSDSEPDEAPKKKASRENTTEFEDVYWNSPKKDREFMETVFPKEVDEAKERKKRRNKARREVDEAIRRMGFFGHSDISTYGAYLAHHGIKGQKWGVRRFQNYDGTRINKDHTSNTADTKQAAKTLNSSYKKYMRAEEEWDDDGMDKAISQLGHDKSFQRSVKPVVDIVNSTYEKHKDVFDKSNDAKSEKMKSYLDDLQKIDDCVKSTAKKLGIKDTASDSYEYNFFANALAGYIDSLDKDENRRFLQSDWIVHGVLEHHGIKGQKWGIRRFQNEDGTRIIKKGTRFKRTSIHEDDPTFDDKKYVSTNNRDARKWRDYLGNAYAQRGRIVYEHEYKTTKDIAVARGKDISAVINEEFKKNPKKWKQLNTDTERAMKMLNYVKDNMSDDDRYSTNFAAQTNSGKEIMRMLQKRGYDAVEDLHGRNVSDDPIIVFNPDENLKHKKVKQHWEYYYRNMYG